MVLDSTSLFLALSNTAILQLCKIYRVPDYNKELEIVNVSVQQQKGGKDCGVFAVAYALDVCLGKNPQYSVFDQTKMRSHLFECFSQGVLKPFPKGSSESLPRPAPTVRHIQVYYKCRMPEYYDERMVCCDGCDGWFHISCVNLKESKTLDIWFCGFCK